MTDILHLDRRSLLERALLLAGGIAASGFNGAALAEAVANGHAFLDASAYSLLSAVADTMIPRTDTPGAIDARVPATFDALLANWASAQCCSQSLEVLNDIDRRARESSGTAFAKLSPERRFAILAPYDGQALQPVAREGGEAGFGALLTGLGVADPKYFVLKELLVTIYYLSEPALTRELIYLHDPGEWQPSIPVTSETRPAGGDLF